MNNLNAKPIGKSGTGKIYENPKTSLYTYFFDDDSLGPAGLWATGQAAGWAIERELW